jgi:hypothetical protein
VFHHQALTLVQVQVPVLVQVAQEVEVDQVVVPIVHHLAQDLLALAALPNLANRLKDNLKKDLKKKKQSK